MATQSGKILLGALGRMVYSSANYWVVMLSDLASSTHSILGHLYEKTIDFDAHPNVASLATAFRTSTSEGRRQFKVLYVSAEPEMIRGTMTSLAQTGVAACRSCGLNRQSQTDRPTFS